MELRLVKSGSDGSLDLYGGVDPRELRRYSYADARRATGVPASTIAAWMRGMSYKRADQTVGYFRPVLKSDHHLDHRLSFNDLLEIHVLRALRSEAYEVVPISRIREAIQFAEKKHGIKRLLIHPQLRTTQGRLFLEIFDEYQQTEADELVELSPSQQLAMRSILSQYLHRVEIDERLRRFEFFPFPRAEHRSPEPLIRVSPLVSFGAPVIRRRGISTAAIAARINAGETKAAVIADYRLDEAEFEEAIRYEAA